MQLRRAILVAILLIGYAVPSGADQSDARLEGLFRSLLTAGDSEEAAPVEREIWEIWFEHHDRAINQLMAKGVSAMNRADHFKALEVFDQMVKIAPGFAEAWNRRATVHFLLQNFNESLDDIERTLALEPRHFGALSGRGLVYTELEQFELAIESFEAALAVNPQMVGPRVNVEAIRKRLKDRQI